MTKPPLVFTFYIAASIEKVWNGFVSQESNRAIFMGADFHVDLEPGGAMTWSGPGKDGRPTRYVTGEVLRVNAPTLLEYRFGAGDGKVMSRVTVTLTSESEAVKVVVTNDEDFLSLHGSGENHSGIAYARPGKLSIGELLRYLLLMHACYESEEMINRVEFMSK